MHNKFLRISNNEEADVLSASFFMQLVQCSAILFFHLFTQTSSSIILPFKAKPVD